MKNFIQRLLTAKGEKTHSKMSEMNEAICDEVKQRMRRVTARHKGYEQFGSNKQFNIGGGFGDNGYDQNDHGDDDSESEDGDVEKECDENNKDDVTSKASSDLSVDFKKAFDEKSSINSNLSSNNYVESNASVFEKITLNSIKLSANKTTNGNQLKPITLNTSSSSSSPSDLKSIQFNLKKPISSQPRKNRAICSSSSSSTYSSNSSSTNSPIQSLSFQNQQLLLQTAPQTLVILN